LSKNKSGFWSFFSSVQLTITLLAIIAFISIIGTIIPQQEAAGEFVRQMSPGLVSFFQMMQVFDLYHSVWFFLLMGLLSLNLIICSLNRFPIAWRRFRTKPSPGETDIYKGIDQERIILTKTAQETVSELAYSVMKARFRHIQKQVADDGAYFCGDKGRIAYLGVYGVHLSILLLIAGAVTGSLFGIEGYVNISEGETVNAIELRGGKGTQSLPFSVRCDRFTIDFYENGAPKTYRSDLAFIRNDRIAYQGPLLVNHPISFEGLRFYQASYGQTPEGKAALSFSRGGEKGQDRAVATGDVFDLPDGGGKVHVLRIEENLMKMGPAIKLSIKSPKGETLFWIFRHIDKIKEMNPGIVQQVPLFNPGLFQPYVFTMKGIEEKYYTGLQVARDPGVPLVIAAAILMILGLMVAFFTSHRQIWIRIDQQGGFTRLSIAGRAHKNAVGLERDIKYLLADIRGRLGDEG
jgi:cytochrome c biogenesis protein